MSCGTMIRVLFSRALSHPKHSRPWLCRGRGCRGGRRERTHTANSMRVGRQVVRAGLHRHRMGDSLLACLMMICSNGPSLHENDSEKEEVEKLLLVVVARFKAFKRRVQSKGCGAHPQRASALFCVQGQILCSVSAFGSGECCIQ